MTLRRLCPFSTLLWGLAVLLCLCAVPSTAQAAPAFTKPFSYYADQQDLSVVLMNFARTQGLGAAMSAGVNGKVSGRFDQVPADTFLAGMRAAFGINWYRVGPTLHFYNEAETTRAFITPHSMSAPQLYDMLRRSSVFSPQLPPSMGPGGDIIVLSGPPDYLSQVMTAVSAFENAQASQFVMRVFPLKYAWAEDIAVNSMDKTVTVPGVASILCAMVTGSPTSATKVTQQPATVNKLAGQGLVAQGKQEPVAPAEPQQVQAAPENSGPAVNIIADPRVNAVLVSDAAYRMPYYAQVIADLDKPVELVEIHAAIVDIDSDFARSLGVTYQGGNKRDDGWSVGGELGSGPGQFRPIPTPGTLTNTGMSLSTIYTHGADFFLTRVQALEKDGEARMLGRPSVLTVDNVQATLENTTTYYIQVQGFQAVDLFKVEAGTILRVTPHIIRDPAGKATIKLAVSVQDDQNTGSNTSTSAMPIPPIKQTKINTQAIVGAGQSLLIGGYYYEQKGTTDSGIPVLMNIPVLGHLFKTSDKTSKRMERLILITPKVLDLNNLPENPPHLDDPGFHRSPTQDTYVDRRPASGSGCSKRYVAFEPDQPEPVVPAVSVTPLSQPVPAPAGPPAGPALLTKPAPPQGTQP